MVDAMTEVLKAKLFGLSRGARLVKRKGVDVDARGIGVYISEEGAELVEVWKGARIVGVVAIFKKEKKEG